MTALRAAEEMSVIFREPHVNHRYRPDGQSISYYVQSAFQASNESMNIWTHALAFMFTLYQLLFTYGPAMDWSDPFYWPFILGVGTCLAMLLASTSAHMFHSRSGYAHYVAFMVDYAGIGLYGLGIGLEHFYYSSEQWFFERFSKSHIPMMLLLSFMSCAVSCRCKVKYRRPYPLRRKVLQVGAVACMYAGIIAPLYSRFSAHCGLGWRFWIIPKAICETSSEKERLYIHSEQIFFFIFSGLFYSGNYPQKWKAGMCDFIGHSHQIFHVAIAVTTHLGNKAVFADLKADEAILRGRFYAKSESMFLTAFHIAVYCLPFVALVLCEVVYIYYLQSSVQDTVDDIRKAEKSAARDGKGKAD